MSSIHIERKNDLITVSRISESEPTLIWKKSIHELIFKETEDTNIPVNEDDRYRVFLWENINEFTPKPHRLNVCLQQKTEPF